MTYIGASLDRHKLQHYFTRLYSWRESSNQMPTFDSVFSNPLPIQRGDLDEDSATSDECRPHNRQHKKALLVVRTVP